MYGDGGIGVEILLVESLKLGALVRDAALEDAIPHRRVSTRITLFFTAFLLSEGP